MQAKLSCSFSTRKREQSGRLSFCPCRRYGRTTSKHHLVVICGSRGQESSHIFVDVRRDARFFWQINKNSEEAQERDESLLCCAKLLSNQVDQHLSHVLGYFSHIHPHQMERKRLGARTY